MIKLRPRRFSRSSSKLSGSGSGSGGATKSNGSSGATGEIEWELRPGGMLVQKRQCKESADELIVIRVSTVSYWHHISIQATSTFGELKILISLLTNLEPQEQRLLFKGKEREDHEHLHMIGVRDRDKVLMLEDPAIKEKKLLGSTHTRVISSSYRTISAN